MTTALYEFYTSRLQNRSGGIVFILLMNLILIPGIILWTLTGLVLFPLVFVFMKYIQGHTTSRITRWCIWIYGKVWQFLSGTFVIFDPVQYQSNQYREPAIIVVNHRSFFDTYCMNMLPESNVCFAVRDWPFKIPVYNLFMNLARYLNIEKHSWEKCLDRSQQTLDEKGLVLFFPEGHRTRTGQMTRFHSGAFKLAVETNTPVIPVCLTGTQDLLPRGRHHMRPARIKMKILDPVFPHDFSGELKHQDMKKQVKALMKNQLALMDE